MAGGNAGSRLRHSPPNPNEATSVRRVDRVFDLARRRCPGAGASAFAVVEPRAHARGGHRAVQSGSRPDRTGASFLYACRRDRRQGAQRGRSRLLPRRQRVPQRAPGRAAERRFRPRHGAPADLRGLRPPLSRCAVAFPARRLGRDCGQGREGDGLPSAPFRRMGDPPGRRNRGKPPSHYRSSRCPVALCRRAVRDGRW